MLDAGLPARGVFTTRQGGASRPPWDSRNLAVHVDDAFATVQANRAALVAALSAGAVRAGRTVDVLLQVSLDGDTARGGALPADLPALAEAVQQVEGLRLAGLMAVAPLGEDPAAAFARLAEVRAQHPWATVLSAGMSGDLEAAIGAGATHVRIGTALLGHRTHPLR